MDVYGIYWVCTTYRDGNDMWLCLDENDKPIVATKESGFCPMLFGSDDAAMDALVEYTSVKGWTLQEVRLTNNV